MVPAFCGVLWLSQRAAPLHVRGGGRVLTVSGQPLLAYHLVEAGHAVTATVHGPLVVDVRLRRHSFVHHGGTSRASLELDGAVVEQIELPARPAGRYLAGFGFTPGPEELRQVTVPAGPHKLVVKSVAGALSAAFSVDIEAAPLVAVAPAPVKEIPAGGSKLEEEVPAPNAEKPTASASSTSNPASSSSPNPNPAPNANPTAQPAESASRPVAEAPPTEPEGAGSRLGEAPAAETTTSAEVAAEAPVPSASRKHVLLALRAGSATQTQEGTTSFGGGVDVRYFVLPHLSVGVGASAYDLSLASALTASPSPQSTSKLSLDLGVVAVPIVAEAAWDVPLSRIFTLSLGLGLGAAYQRFDQSIAAGPSAYRSASPDGAVGVGELFSDLSVAVPAGRAGIQLRFSSSLPEDVPGVVRGLVLGALYAEVGYQFLL